MCTEEEDEKDDLISAVQFLHILEESIRTFMAFLRADKRSHYQMFREMVRRRTSAGDQSIVITLKRTNKAVSDRHQSSVHACMHSYCSFLNVLFLC